MKRMNFIFLKISVVCIVLLLSLGCEEFSQTAAPSQRIEVDTDNIYGPYQPQRVELNGLTRFIISDNGQDQPILKAHVDVIDRFGSRIKSPMQIRFELFEFSPRSSDPKGPRIYLWQDINLLDPHANQENWNDYLRTYIFQLPCRVSLKSGTSFMLQTTCIRPDNRRIMSEARISYPN